MDSHRNHIRREKLSQLKLVFIQQVNPHAKDVDYGDVSERIALRKKLKCADFKWYLDNVYPDLLPPENGKGDVAKNRKNAAKGDLSDKFVPWDKRERNYEQAFVIKVANLNLCVQVSILQTISFDHR